MTLPRLRVRELMFLVVYAALIGQAFVLCTLGQRVNSVPSTVPGYVWVEESDAASLDLPEGWVYVWVDPQGGLRMWQADGTNADAEFEPLQEATGDLDDRTYYLVPEELVK